jgi:hypothetical protein
MAAETGLIKWQLPMQRVLYAAAPLVLAGVYFFGWRVLAMLAVANAVGFLAEYAFTRGWKEPVSSAVFVTGTLFTLADELFGHRGLQEKTSTVVRNTRLGEEVVYSDLGIQWKVGRVGLPSL